MKSIIYLYSDISCQKIVKEIFFDFDVEELFFEKIKENNFKNKNVLFVIKDVDIEFFEKSFFFNNNVVIFSTKKQNELYEKELNNSKFYYAPQNLKKFLDEIKSYFLSSAIIFKDIKIVNETAHNLSLGNKCALTELERSILLQLIDKKKIERKYFLEKILEINKDTETKTIESHLTRIRKKLLQIKSNIQITSKDDVFSIEFWATNMDLLVKKTL